VAGNGAPNQRNEIIEVKFQEVDQIEKVAGGKTT